MNKEFMDVPFAGIVDSNTEGTEIADEYSKVIEAMQTGWHGPGFICNEFEKEFSKYLGVDYALLTNSGSSANLLALKSLGLPEGSKVLTSGCGFPATLNPIIHLGLEPVLVDYDLETQNIDLTQVEHKLLYSNLIPDETKRIKAMIVAHTMGNPINMVKLIELAEEYNVWVISDCCEALGSKLNGVDISQYGDIATFSFYPSHQLNGLGGGGCIVTNNEKFALECRSLRNWGKVARDIKFIGEHVTNYSTDVDGILYDDQYTYMQVGFNFQPTDVQAAYLREQLKRLPEFIRRRKENWEYLNKHINISQIKTMIIIDNAEPSYFGYSMVLTDNLVGQRDIFAKYLMDNNIKSRPYFAGNISRHEPYKYLYTELPIADYLMKDALFIGVWPGLTLEHMKYVVNIVNLYKSNNITSI